MVSVLNSGWNGLGSSSDQNTAFCSFVRHSTLKELLPTRVYKWVLAKLMLWDNPAMYYHPIQRG